MQNHIDWHNIDTVILDLDGTLLDLYFDNYFWRQLIPQVYADHNHIDLATSQADIFGRMKRVRGQLQWYCLDYWQRQLSLDLFALKQSVRHLIRCRAQSIQFLQWLKERHLTIILLTNAHPFAMTLKLTETGLATYFDHCVSTHHIGFCKEQPQCWQQLCQRYQIDKHKALFIDDSQWVLDSALAFGIATVVGITQPDSSLAANRLDNVIAIADFNEIMR